MVTRGRRRKKKSLKIPEVIRRRKSKDREHNDQKKKDREHNDQKKKTENTMTKRKRQRTQ